MKNNIKKFALGLALSGTLFSCQDFDELNVSRNNPRTASAAQLLPSAQRLIGDQLLSTTDVNENVTGYAVQYFARTNYTSENVFNYRYSVYDNHFGNLYNPLAEIQKAHDLVEAQPVSNAFTKGVKANQLSILKVIKALILQSITDAYGSIPVDEASDVLNHATPAFQTQEEAYKTVFRLLGEAIGDVDKIDGFDLGSDSQFGAQDIYFQGDVAKWISFAHTLRMRAAMRLSDVNEPLARPEFEKSSGKGIASNADNAKLVYMDDQNNNNPLVTGWDWNLALSETLVGHLTLESTKNENGVDTEQVMDPRIGKYAQGAWSADGTYVGFPISNSNYSSITTGVARYDHAYLNYGIWNKSEVAEAANFPSVLAEYSEVLFLEAEAKERGWGSEAVGTPEELWKMAIMASFEKWGVTQEEQDAYFAHSAAAYDGTNWKKSIGTQKYLALFLQSGEAWSEWRRLDYPKLTLPVANGKSVKASDMTVRYEYPPNEKAVNGTNVEKAIQDIGGSDLTTVRLWWDVNPYTQN